MENTLSNTTSSWLVIGTIVAYFAMLLVISWVTGRKADNNAFFLGNRKSPWYVVAFGMIGASLSGVTFISVPGWVGSSSFSYMQMVLGYLLGYIAIANILMPMYYRLQLTSIYTYLDERFGKNSYKTGASFFLLSRVIGAAFRLFLVANVLQITVFDAWNIPFAASVVITILLIWLYTYRGGIKTIIWTDTLQTIFMLLAVGISVYFIADEMKLDFAGLVKTVKGSEYSQIFFFDDWKDKRFFFKQFLAGAFITIVMTGLDQDMMQKNLSCKNIGDAKKNMYWFSLILVPVNLLFLGLGALLFLFAQSKGISLPAHSDDLFPLVATGGFLTPILTVVFILGLIAAAYSSADSALTALTTSFSVDILNINKYKEETKRKRIRMIAHIGFSVLLVLVILLFKAINNQSVISAIFTVAGYTYGPLLGLYAFGLFTKLQVRDRIVPYLAIASPVIAYFIKSAVSEYFGWEIGFELLIINGMITYGGLLLISLAGKK
ncbi:MAG: sodium:solute symporter [Bacteroidales bacterium]|nr:sodium:solute symporter [Bacteroidales bacterium]MCF8458898.1 sodium:solute symporter [Bacteroidales bacterium]